jgi:hypothetical protein
MSETLALASIARAGTTGGRKPLRATQRATNTARAINPQINSDTARSGKMTRGILRVAAAAAARFGVARRLAHRVKAMPKLSPSRENSKEPSSAR